MVGFRERRDIEVCHTGKPQYLIIGVFAILRYSIKSWLSWTAVDHLYSDYLKFAWAYTTAVWYVNQAPTVSLLENQIKVFKDYGNTEKVSFS